MNFVPVSSSKDLFMHSIVSRNVFANRWLIPMFSCIILVLFQLELEAARRGIQALYFSALSSDFASDLCDKINLAPANRPVEIEFSPVFSGGNGRLWANAKLAI